MKYRYLLTISLWSENGTIAWAHMLLCWYLRKSNASLVQVVQDQRSSGKKPDVLLIIFTQGRTIWVVKFSKYQLENMYIYIYYFWLVEPPLRKIWLRQLGWWHSQYDGKVIIHSMVPLLIYYIPLKWLKEWIQIIWFEIICSIISH